MDEPDSITLLLLRNIRGDMGDMKVFLKELASTQAALLQITATQENRLLRIEADISTIKKRIGLIEA